MTTAHPLDKATALSSEALPHLAIKGPRYGRSAMRIGIVHIGVGGFHRAHQALYLDDLMNAGEAHDWAICGMGVLPGDAAMRDVLTAQEGLYTLVTKYPDGSAEARVVGAIVRYLHAPDDPEVAVEQLADPSVRIVSLTITEGGYNFNQNTGEFDPSHPDIAHDLSVASGEAEAGPRSVFGLVIEALARRRSRGNSPFTVMSCDNIQGNGEVARRQFTAFAALRDVGLATWIDANVAFPSSMVDRITPVTTDEDREMVAKVFGVRDRWPVVCEPFTQWVLEDRFPAGRPSFDQVGVQLVTEVGPYELMKLRLLNASHQALCYPGYLAGYRFAHEVCADPDFVAYLLAYMDEEATPTLEPVPGVDLAAYKNQLIARFANPAIRDTLARLCADSSNRIPKWLLPVVHSNLAAGRSVTLSAAIVASWAYYAEGRDDQGGVIDVVDPRKEQVIAAAARQRGDDPLAFLRDTELFGELAEQDAFTGAYLSALASFRENGARTTIARYARGARS